MRNERQREQDELDYAEGVEAYHRGWDDRAAGREDRSAEDSTGHYAGGWEACDEGMASSATGDGQ